MHRKCSSWIICITYTVRQRFRDVVILLCGKFSFHESTARGGTLVYVDQIKQCPPVSEANATIVADHLSISNTAPEPKVCHQSFSRDGIDAAIHFPSSQ